MKKPKKINLVYAGLRIGSDGKVSQCFVHNKKERYWSNIKWVTIGHKYPAELHPDGTTSMKYSPEDLGEADVDPTVLDVWREKNALAEQHRRTKAAYTRAKNIQPELDKLLDPIREKFRKYNTMEEIAAFEKLIVRMLHAPMSKKR